MATVSSSRKTGAKSSISSGWPPSCTWNAPRSNRSKKPPRRETSPAAENQELAERRARIEQSLAGIETQLHHAREKLSEAYHGVRRHEIAASARAEQHRRRQFS
jgi:hypothetical protein